MADWIDAGRVKILPKGVWNEETPYEVDDIVTYHHYAYICIKDNIGVHPQESQTSEYWEEFGSAVDGDNETIVINEGIISGIDYVKKTYVDTELGKKQNTLTPGDHISIVGDVISSDGASTWTEVGSKPFETIGENLTVGEDGSLNAKGGTEIAAYTLEEYEAIKDTIPTGTQFIITDDFVDTQDYEELAHEVAEVKQDLTQLEDKVTLKPKSTTYAGENSEASYTYSFDIYGSLLACTVMMTPKNNKNAGDYFDFTLDNIPEISYIMGISYLTVSSGDRALYSNVTFANGKTFRLSGRCTAGRTGGVVILGFIK